MKKIGIMTMQRVVNYGSFLQSYGLMKNISSLGYEVSFVDFKVENPVIEDDNNFLSKIKRNINVINFVNKKKTQKEFSNKYNEFLKILKINEQRNELPNNIDELVIGSDEVFNCLQPLPVGYSKELFGKDFENIPVISYAASFGHTTIDGLKKYHIDNEIGDMLSKFKSISVRDQNTYNIVNQLINKKPIINLDPVLVTDYSEEMIDNVKLKDYIIVYAYTGRLTKNEEIEIKKFAKNNNKKIVSLGMYQKIADYNLVVHPFEIFAYFKHADFIITDTFHGSIFSIKTHSKFATIIRNGKFGNSNKLYDLLQRLNRTDRIITDISNLEKMRKKDIDYNDTDKIIEEERKKSIEYLRNNLIK